MKILIMILFATIITIVGISIISFLCGYDFARSENGHRNFLEKFSDYGEQFYYKTHNIENKG